MGSKWTIIKLPILLKMKIFLTKTLLLALSLPLLLSACLFQEEASLRAGLRASGYGISPFPPPQWWLFSTDSMASNFDEASPAVVWIVGTINGKYSQLTFPLPDGKSGKDYENILFSSLDNNEAYLTQFDEQGVKVWLQVEPADANVETLIDLVLNRYASHPCVVGFGVDVEWYQRKSYYEGKEISDEEASLWIKKVHSYNPEYNLFLKHWLVEKMPPSYREGLMFLDDSQDFESLNEMKNEFSDWGAYFSPAMVGFQYGYSADRTWWGEFDNPPAEIGKALLEEIPNTSDLFWVDFTAKEIWESESK